MKKKSKFNKKGTWRKWMGAAGFVSVFVSKTFSSGQNLEWVYQKLMSLLQSFLSLSICIIEVFSKILKRSNICGHSHKFCTVKHKFSPKTVKKPFKRLKINVQKYISFVLKIQNNLQKVKLWLICCVETVSMQPILELKT